MIGTISRGYAAGATTKSTIMTARNLDTWEGAKKVFSWGERPAGQPCSRAREISQGGVGR